jgi:hypothetical protein
MFHNLILLFFLPSHLPTQINTDHLICHFHNKYTTPGNQFTSKFGTLPFITPHSLYNTTLLHLYQELPFVNLTITILHTVTTFTTPGGPNGKQPSLSIVTYRLLSRITATAKVSSIQETSFCCVIIIKKSETRMPSNEVSHHFPCSGISPSYHNINIASSQHIVVHLNIRL